LVLALLTNPAFVAPLEGERRLELGRVYAELWDTISGWPCEYPCAKVEFFRRVDAPVGKKLEVYKASQEVYVRLAILEGWCNGEDSDARALLDLATGDVDPECRQFAYSKLLLDMVSHKTDAIGRATDKALLIGLCCNPNLTKEQLKAISRRVSDLNLWGDVQSLARQSFQPNGGLRDNLRYLQKIRDAEFVWSVTSLFGKLTSQVLPPTKVARYGIFALDWILGCVILATSAGLLFATPEGQRATTALLIIISSSVLWVVWQLPIHFAYSDAFADSRLIHLKGIRGNEASRAEENLAGAVELLRYRDTSASSR
jgi:hypothetical protein